MWVVQTTVGEVPLLLSDLVAMLVRAAPLPPPQKPKKNPSELYLSYTEIQSSSVGDVTVSYTVALHCPLRNVHKTGVMKTGMDRVKG